MKLLTLTNRYYIFIALFLVLAANSYVVFRVMHFVDNETKEHMIFEKEIIIKQLRDQPFLNDKKFSFADFIEVLPIERMTIIGNIFKDTAFYAANEFEIVPFTELTTEAIVNGKFVHLKIRRRLTEHEDILSSIAIPFTITGLLIIISFLFLNRWFSKIKFKPFHHALEGLKKFDLAKSDTLNLLPTNIKEFQSLNVELYKLTRKVKRDYQNLKEFTENVSHETKVPISVVQARLEMLLQSPNLVEQEKLQVSSALEAIYRLTNKNNALSLLSKIDSRGYLIKVKIEANALITKLLEEMQDFINYKKLKLEIINKDKIVLDSNEELIDILFTNLLSNAIKYNAPEGSLIIKFTANIISIANSGEQLKIPASEIFDRYSKGDHPESIGLGLAILKKICSLYNYDINYEWNNGLHIFSCIIQSHID